MQQGYLSLSKSRVYFISPPHWTFYFFILNAFWLRGMGKMPIPPTFYFFTFLLLKVHAGADSCAE